MFLNKNVPLNIVSREEWGALPPSVEQEKFKRPCITVRLWLYSDTPSCTTREDCTRTVQGIQRRHMESGMDDIRFNFLIGEDGNVYEGRGYDKVPPKDDIVSEMWGKYLELGFIGDHRRTQRVNNIFHLAYLVSDSAVKKGALKYEANILYED